MCPQRKTKQQLLMELRALRKRNEELEAFANESQLARMGFQGSDELLRKVFKTIPDLFAFIDRDFRILLSNWHGGYDYVPEEVRKGTPICYKAYYNSDKPCDHCHVAEVFKTGKPVTREKMNPRIGHVEIRAYPIFDESNNVILVTENIRDITKRKQAEEALEKARDSAEQANEALKTTHKQLLHQEKMASIGQLAAGVAHEINNPMAFITSNFSTLNKYMERLSAFIGDQDAVFRGDLNPDDLAAKRKELKVDKILNDAARLIEESLEGAERVRKIVQDLKGFSRVDEAEYKYADMNQCLESTINIVWNELKYKAKLVKELDDIPQIQCWPRQLNQVFMNLLVNAANSIEKQGNIVVKTSSDERNVYITVSDTGSGIPDEIRERIFEPFFTTKEVGKGTGLGLSISYDIVKKHGGEITVVSEVGKGSLFRVRLPFKVSEEMV